MSKLMSTVMLTAAVVISSVAVRAEGLAVKNGETIAFLGDSITQQGAAPGGYVSLVMSGLEANGIKATAIPAGIGGNMSNHMLARLDKDVLSKKPDWMTLSCGVNDVWLAKGVPLEKFKVNITKIVEQVQAANIKLMILTPTMKGEDQSNANNQRMVGYNDFLRTLATEKKCLLADLNADMQAIIAKAGPEKKGNMLTKEGIHMNPAGNKMMASGVLKAFGMNEEQLAKAQEAWAKAPTPAAAPKKAQ